MTARTVDDAHRYGRIFRGSNVIVFDESGCCVAEVPAAPPMLAALERVRGLAASIQTRLDGADYLREGRDGGMYSEVPDMAHGGNGVDPLNQVRRYVHLGLDLPVSLAEVVLRELDELPILRAEIEYLRRRVMELGDTGEWPSGFRMDTGHGNTTPVFAEEMVPADPPQAACPWCHMRDCVCQI